MIEIDLELELSLLLSSVWRIGLSSAEWFIDTHRESPDRSSQSILSVESIR